MVSLDHETHGSNDWLVDSGASKHMKGHKESFVNMYEHESPHKVKIGDDYQYPIKVSGEASFKLDSEKYLKIKYVLYVLGWRMIFSSYLHYMQR